MKLTVNPHCVVRLTLVLALSCPATATGQEPPQIRLGPITGEADRGFTRLKAMRELPDGRLLVTDTDERVLYAISFGGQRGVRQVGRRGQGPREYSVPWQLYGVGADSTLMMDGTRTRWLLLRGTEVVEILVGRAPVLEELELIVGSSGDRIVDVIGVSWAPDALPGAASTADSIALRFLTRPWEASDGLPPMDTLGFRMRGAGAGGLAGCAMAATSGGGRVAAESGVRLCGDLFPVQDQAATFADGWIAVAHVDPYHVSWRAPDGRWTEGPLIQVDTIPYTEMERCAAAQGWDYTGIGICEDSEYGMRAPPDRYYPFVRTSSSRRSLPGTRSVLAAPDGNLVIRRTPTTRTYVNTLYDVIDRNGARVGRIRLPADQAILGFGAASVYTVRTDEVDLQWVRRHDWPPGG